MLYAHVCVSVCCVCLCVCVCVCPWGYYFITTQPQFYNYLLDTLVVIEVLNLFKQNTIIHLTEQKLIMLHCSHCTLFTDVTDPHHDHADYHNTSQDTTRSPAHVTMTTNTPIMSAVTSNKSMMSTTTHSSRVVDDVLLITAAKSVTSPTVTSRTSSTGSSVASSTGATATAMKTSAGQQFNVLLHATATSLGMSAC